MYYIALVPFFFKRGRNGTAIKKKLSIRIDGALEKASAFRCMICRIVIIYALCVM